ncbi:MAG TPA: SRPBCC family protein [Anaerolineales bacterium]
MAKMTKSVTINAPVDKVFTFMRDPNNMPEIWPGMVLVKDVKRSPLGGFNYSWVYKMAGLRFDGASEVADYIANQRLVMMSTRGINSTFRWNLEPQNGGTKLTLEVENLVPVPLLGRVAEAFIFMANEHDAGLILANLKARMEVLAINLQRS